MRNSLGNKLVEEVRILGELLSIKPAHIEKGCADARLIASRYNLEPSAVRVSIIWQRKFVRRPTYGQAFNALLGVVGASWDVANNLKGLSTRVTEAKLVERQSAREHPFIFSQITYDGEMDGSANEMRRNVIPPENPATVWDYLCYFLVEPEHFKHRLMIAVGDGVPWTLPDDVTHAPAILFNGRRLTVSGIPRESRSNGIAYHYIRSRTLEP